MAVKSRLGRPTVETISERAGVAPSTVSRALKGDKRISEETRASIAAIARQLQYYPNASARSLRTRRSGLVGFVMSGVDNPFYAELMECTVARAAGRGLHLVVLHASREPLKDSVIESLLQYRMDGCIITSAVLTSRAAEACQQYRVPVVMINRVPRVHGCAVSCNNLLGGKLIGELLVAAGHRKIAIVAGMANTSTSLDRETGATQALAAHGLAPFERFEGSSTYDGGYAAGQVIATQSQRPEAVYAINDAMALGVIDGCRRHGLRIPEDVSVIGFDNIRAAAWHAYGLTTVAQPIDAMVDRALDLLEARMKDPEIPGEEAYINGELKVRGSARLPEDLQGFLANFGVEYSNPARGPQAPLSPVLWIP